MLGSVGLLGFVMFYHPTRFRARYSNDAASRFTDKTLRVGYEFSVHNSDGYPSAISNSVPQIYGFEHARATTFT
jgi:hypothetical protein